MAYTFCELLRYIGFTNGRAFLTGRAIGRNRLAIGRGTEAILSGKALAGIGVSIGAGSCTWCSALNPTDGKLGAVATHVLQSW